MECDQRNAYTGCGAENKMVAGDPAHLLRRAGACIRQLGVGVRAERACLGWIRRFARHNHRRRTDMDAASVEKVFVRLESHHGIPATVRNQLWKDFMELFREASGEYQHAQGRDRVWNNPHAASAPLTRVEVVAWIAELSGMYGLVASLLYGSGLRLSECLRMRVVDLDFDRRQICIRSESGRGDRHTPLPNCLHALLLAQVEMVKRLHRCDARMGVKEWLPGTRACGWARKSEVVGWQHVFPAVQRRIDSGSGKIYRPHLEECGVRRALKGAAVRAGILRPVNSLTLRRCFARHLRDAGYDARAMKRPLEHGNDFPVHNDAPAGIGANLRSPLDR